MVATKRGLMIRNGVVAGAAMLTIAGCAGNSVENRAEVAAAVAEASAIDPVYRLGLGDKVRIDVFGETNLSGEYVVTGNGELNFPLVGQVKATGMTAQELGAMLTQRLGDGFLRNPRVTATVLEFRPFFILGEVERPGRYPTVEGLTIVRAIATAGGFTYRANTRRLFIRRPGETQEREVPFDADVPVAPGDVIRVGERYF